MKHAYNKTRQKRTIRRFADESLNLPFNCDSDSETISVVAQQVLEDVRRETLALSTNKVPDYVLDYLAEFKSIDRLTDSVIQNVIKGLDESGQAYYMELVELMAGEGHKLSRYDAVRTALKLALKHSRGSGKYDY